MGLHVEIPQPVNPIDVIAAEFNQQQLPFHRENNFMCFECVGSCARDLYIATHFDDELYLVIVECQFAAPVRHCYEAMRLTNIINDGSDGSVICTFDDVERVVTFRAICEVDGDPEPSDVLQAWQNMYNVVVNASNHFSVGFLQLAENSEALAHEAYGLCEVECVGSA